MPKHAAHATLERERTRSRIVDDEPAPPAALEECLGVLPLGDDDDLATFDLFRPDGVVSAIDVEGLPDEDAVALGYEAHRLRCQLAHEGLSRAQTGPPGRPIHPPTIPRAEKRAPARHMHAGRELRSQRLQLPPSGFAWPPCFQRPPRPART